MDKTQQTAPLLNRIRSLRRKHQAIEHRIRREVARPLPDYFLLQRLKRSKLQLKDEANRLLDRLRRFASPPPEAV